MVVSASCYPGVAAGMTALQIFYNSSTGLWNTSKWWQAGNVLETTIDYSRITNTKTYHSHIRNTFEKNKDKNFINKWFYDDDGWWALTWIKAYDLTGETQYLDMAKTIFNDMKQGWDSTCGGGIWWKKRGIYKNAITNELFLSVAARLHLRTPGDKGPGSYLDWAQRTWRWFKDSGMINSNNLVNDGLDSNCKNNGKTIWSYNQGVILGGLVDLYKITNDSSLLIQAEAIADATTRKLAPKGILQELCEPSNCGVDVPQFKGVFIRNLHYLYEITNKPAYKDFITQNANSIWLHRNENNQFGLNWAGPVDSTDAARQSSAMDAINAAIAVNIKGITYQAQKSTQHKQSTQASNDYLTCSPSKSSFLPTPQPTATPVTTSSPGGVALIIRYFQELIAGIFGMR
jgi:predicted alpha-1,6-mannanase (GH76 family)